MKLLNTLLVAGAASAALGVKYLLDRNKDREQQEDSVNFSRLAVALANDFDSVYYLNTDDDSYVEFGTKGDKRDLKIISKGEDFFADTIVNCKRLVYEEDQQQFLDVLKKENLIAKLDRSGAFIHNYRLVVNGEPKYYYLKSTRGADVDRNRIIIGIKNVDEQVRKEKEAAARNETYSQIATALASRYEVIYYVNVTTDEFTEYTSSSKYAKLKIGAHGMDFFGECQKNMKRDIYPEDYPMMAAEIRKERILSELSKDDTYSITYRLMLGGSPEYVNLRAVRAINDKNHIIIGVSNIDAAKRRELEFKEALGSAINMATRDELTGVKNKMAYAQNETQINEQIRNGTAGAFSVAVCDVNGLKLVNDSDGHQAGDEYLKSACQMICKVFKHSPVFRIGGDEFAILMHGDDFDAREELMKILKDQVRTSKESGGVTLACGMGVFNPDKDKDVGAVFKRADAAMYRNKKTFKR